MKKVRIIGAGFSGLSLALELTKLGVAVEITEASDRAGGFITSPKTSHGIYETAANGFLSNQRVEDFVQELNLTALRPKRAAKKRYFFRGYPQRWPLKFFETISMLMYFLSAFFRRALKPRYQETIYQWGQRNLGPAATKFILEPALQGIYAGDSKVLSAELIFNPQKAAGRNQGLLSFEGGMGEMIDRMVQILNSRGVKFHFSKPFDPAEAKAPPTVICTPAIEASSILQRWPQIPGADFNGEILRKIEMRPLTTVTSYFSKAPARYSGFGILFPKSENRWALGVLQNSNIFARKASAFSETWILPGVDETDDQIKAKLQAERNLIYGESAEPLEIKVTRWSRALPHYTVEHKILIDQLIPMKQVWLHGNYLGRIGLSKILARSQSLAQEIHLTLLNSKENS